MIAEEKEGFTRRQLEAFDVFFQGKSIGWRVQMARDGMATIETVWQEPRRTLHLDTRLRYYTLCAVLMSKENRSWRNVCIHQPAHHRWQ